MAEGEEGSAETVKFISADGHEFVVDRKCALVSGTIKSMLSGPGFAEQQSGEISFREISTPILEKVIQYFYYKVLEYTRHYLRCTHLVVLSDENKVIISKV
eukprot:Phypoly_transcript_15122.p1 GENE.Phypoly_transcript_15122~~Phypoly_transcript_15122.p1  ORF type:complete len:101 (+),score=12.06 Phypoly_transcript_15122:114-416(+)